MDHDSPVRITVSSSGVLHNAALSSPVRQASISNFPLSGGEIRRLSGGRRRSAVSTSGGSEYVAYTVHIPPTPDHTFISNSQNSPEYQKSTHGNPNENRIKDTVFTSGFNSETRAHARRMKSVEEITVSKSKSLCQIDGCDGKLLDKSSRSQCECGFRICDDCYIDYCSNGAGICPGCKEPFQETGEEDDDDDDLQPMMSEEEDTVNPMRRNRNGVRLENNFSLVRSFKAHNQEFDQTRWLFKTNGTYGFGNAVWPREGCHRASEKYEYENLPVFNDRRNRPLSRKVGISAAIISLYRSIGSLVLTI